VLAPLAEELIAAPSSQAYVECKFSVCSWFTSGRRNRISTNMRVLLKTKQQTSASITQTQTQTTRLLLSAVEAT